MKTVVDYLKKDFRATRSQLFCWMAFTIVILLSFFQGSIELQDGVKVDVAIATFISLAIQIALLVFISINIVHQDLVVEKGAAWLINGRISRRVLLLEKTLFVGSLFALSAISWYPLSIQYREHSFAAMALMVICGVVAFAAVSESLEDLLRKSLRIVIICAVGCFLLGLLVKGVGEIRAGQCLVTVFDEINATLKRSNGFILCGVTLSFVAVIIFQYLSSKTKVALSILYFIVFVLCLSEIS